MKYVTVPEPIKLVNPTTGDVLDREIDFREFAIGTLMSDPSWIKDAKAIEASIGVSKAIRSGVDTGTVALEDAQYDRLKQCVEHPTQGYQGNWHPAVLPQLYPFFDAILSAKKEAPAKE